MSEEQTVPEAGVGLQSWADKTATQLLCNAILRWIIRRLKAIGLQSLAEQGSVFSTATAIVVLTLALYVVSIAFSKLFNPFIPTLNLGTFLVSFLSAFALGIVKYLHDTILLSGEDNFARQIIVAVEEGRDNAFVPLVDWWKSFLNLRNQILFVLMIGTVGVIVLWLFEVKARFDFHAGSYLLMFVFGVTVGQGGYCALRIPMVAKNLSKMPMELFWLNPANTRWVRGASWVFAKLSLANALIGTCILIGFLWLRPWASSMTFVIASLLLLFTWAVVLYSFFYPHYYLSKTIRAEKSKHLLRLQEIIETNVTTHSENGASENEIRGIFEIIRVYDQVATAQSSAINTQAVLGLLLSLGAPALSFIVPLVNLARWFTETAKVEGH